jgi:hypothetical protein
MSVTGRFRTDIIAAAAGHREPVVAAVAVPGATPYSNWLERMQRTRGRHAAITKNLYTWSNYKNWAEKVRGDWEDKPAKARLDKFDGRFR